LTKEKVVLKVPVDFNTEDLEGRIDINTDVHLELLEHLRPNLPLLLSEPGLEVEALAVYDPDFKRWYGIPDWSTRRDT
jgi:hypothetical protein